VRGRATLIRQPDGFQLVLNDHSLAPGHACSVWFQVCKADATVIENGTQRGRFEAANLRYVTTRDINMSGSGGVANGGGNLHVVFRLPVGPIPPVNECGLDPASPRPTCDRSGPKMKESTPLTSEMVMTRIVRLVVKDHGPAANFADPDALRIAVTRTDGPECQPHRHRCPDHHTVIFPGP